MCSLFSPMQDFGDQKRPWRRRSGADGLLDRRALAEAPERDLYAAPGGQRKTPAERAEEIRLLEAEAPKLDRRACCGADFPGRRRHELIDSPLKIRVLAQRAASAGSRSCRRGSNVALIFRAYANWRGGDAGGLCSPFAQRRNRSPRRPRARRLWGGRQRFAGTTRVLRLFASAWRNAPREPARPGRRRCARCRDALPACARAWRRCAPCPKGRRRRRACYESIGQAALRLGLRDYAEGGLSFFARQWADVVADEPNWRLRPLNVDPLRRGG